MNVPSFAAWRNSSWRKIGQSENVSYVDAHVAWATRCVEYDRQICVRQGQVPLPIIDTSWTANELNDTLVAFSSGRGEHGFQKKVLSSSGQQSLAWLKDNHASIGGGMTGTDDLFGWLRAAEEKVGDLKR